MVHAQDTHFFSDFGALCGVTPPYLWSMNEARTTCGECRRLLEEGLRNRPVLLSVEARGARLAAQVPREAATVTRLGLGALDPEVGGRAEPMEGRREVHRGRERRRG